MPARAGVWFLGGVFAAVITRDQSSGFLGPEPMSRPAVFFPVTRPLQPSPVSGSADVTNKAVLDLATGSIATRFSDRIAQVSRIHPKDRVTHRMTSRHERQPLGSSVCCGVFLGTGCGGRGVGCGYRGSPPGQTGPSCSGVLIVTLWKAARLCVGRCCDDTLRPWACPKIGHLCRQECSGCQREPKRRVSVSRPVPDHPTTRTSGGRGPRSRTTRHTHHPKRTSSRLPYGAS